MSVDINRFKPKGKWLLIKADPRVKKTRGGIELPDMQLKAERVMEGTGHILKVGNDREGILNVTGGVMLEPGMRVFYRGFLKDASCAEFAVGEDGQPIFLLRAEDVLGIIDSEDIKMGIYS